MSKKAEEIRKKLKEAFKAPVQLFPAIVKSDVNEQDLTVDVEPIEGAPINDVRLKAAIDGVTDGMVEFPKKGSSVLIALIGNEDIDCVVIKCSEVDKVVLFGGQNGGLINIKTLIEELNKTNQAVQTLIDLYSNWTPVPNDGGTALKTIAGTSLATVVLGDYTNMEDIKVTH